MLRLWVWLADRLINWPIDWLTDLLVSFIRSSVSGAWLSEYGASWSFDSCKCLCDRLWSGPSCAVGPIDDWTGGTGGGYIQLNMNGDTCEHAGLRPVESASECKEAVRAINKFRRQRTSAVISDTRGQHDCAEGLTDFSALDMHDIRLLDMDDLLRQGAPTGCSTGHESVPWGDTDRARWCTFTSPNFIPKGWRKAQGLAAREAGVVEAHWGYSHGGVGTATPVAKPGVYLYCHAS